LEITFKLPTIAFCTYSIILQKFNNFGTVGSIMVTTRMPGASNAPKTEVRSTTTAGLGPDNSK